MSELLPLKEGIIYGPVHSRRLGRSLGINLLPPGRKLCTFDCLYCQYGWTPAAAAEKGKPAKLPAPEEVVEALEAALLALEEPPAYLTFSGNGEPTLHPDFPGIVEAVIGVRNRLAPHADTALLSNSSRVGASGILGAVLRIDRPIMKLDAGNEAVFRAFNRPAAGADYERMIAGLAALAARKGISLQSLFAAGPMGNLDEGHVRDWADKVRMIQPRDVQIYSISRPVPSRAIAPASRESLAEIEDRLRRLGIEATAF
jgi:wyosine [tRNA(Phe)-imidazoG37] synthetase (radical SAM superfamily)